MKRKRLGDIERARNAAFARASHLTVAQRTRIAASGGEARASKLSAARRSEIARQAGKASAAKRRARRSTPASKSE